MHEVDQTFARVVEQLLEHVEELLSGHVTDVGVQVFECVHLLDLVVFVEQLQVGFVELALQFLEILRRVGRYSPVGLHQFNQ